MLASILALLLAAPAAVPQVQLAQGSRHARRDLKRRAITITDANLTSVPELHVAGATATTLTFKVPVNPDAVSLPDVASNFFPLQTTEATVTILPKKDLASDAVASLTVGLADGTVLSFKLITVAGEADLQVDVTVAVERAAPPESPRVLKSTIASLRAQLDDCQATSGNAGLAKVASLILAQDPEAPQPFERRGVGKRDKQERLLVEARHLYRLFGYYYLLITVENRDPDRQWLLDKTEVRLRGSGETIDVKVLAHEIDLQAIPPGETAKVVVVFASPQQRIGQSFSVSLLEKNGNRHVTLSLDL